MRVRMEVEVVRVVCVEHDRGVRLLISFPIFRRRPQDRVGLTLNPHVRYRQIDNICRCARTRRICRGRGAACELLVP